MENIKEFVKVIRFSDNFIKMQLVVGFIVTLSWSLIIPVIAKLQGVLWTLSAIAFYKIVKHMGNFLLPLLNNIGLKGAYKIIIIIDTLYLVSVPLYFVNPAIFLVAEAINMVAYTIVMNKFHTIYNRFLVDRCEDKSEYYYIQDAGKMSRSAASIIGYSVVIAVDIISTSMDTAMYTFAAILSINLAFQYYNYFTYWNEENLKVLQEGS